ncbi:MAG: bifunctional sulfate adenylyltransferase/adenylylsulfate kinase [Chloroflexi bacterium]|nr:bifunctional sulfate adenylyltransferase/adenylylsulfate kinase [Chloroflexota bacterium]
MTRLVSPYGGALVELRVSASEIGPLKALASRLPSIQLSDRASCDLEVLASGGFSPLDRFMGRADYESVLSSMRLADGTLFPIPITLPVAAAEAPAIGQEVALRNSHNELLAVMRVEQAYPWDAELFAEQVLATRDPRHPLVAELPRWGSVNLSGPLRVVKLPEHFDFPRLRRTPAETRAALQAMGSANVVAFQTRNPLHRAHEELTRRAADEVGGSLLLHPSVGLTRPGDVDHYTRVRSYLALVERYYDPGRTLLGLLPLAMRMAGPREALWHALIRRNYGANHLIVGRDHASPGIDSHGQRFYEPYAAQELVRRYAPETGVTPVPFRELVYVPSLDRYEEVSRVPPREDVRSLSGTQVRTQFLDPGRPLPTWFTRPEVAEILAETYPPRHRQGVCIWFTGLSGSGKSSTAEAVTALLLERARQVTLLDGDVVRTHLSRGLGFSKEDRDTNIRRIGFVAAEIVRHGGAVVCAAISPYRATRDEVRGMVGDDRFVEVYMDTPLAVCEQRDAKGMYARARRGEIRGWTGIDDPYEAPEAPELRLETVEHDVGSNAGRVLELLVERGYVRQAPP